MVAIVVVVVVAAAAVIVISCGLSTLSLWLWFLTFCFGCVGLATFEIFHSLFPDLFVDNWLSSVVYIGGLVVVLTQSVHPLTYALNFVIFARRLRLV